MKPLVSDATAHAVVQAIMDAELLGVALLRGPNHVHALVNGKYEALIGYGLLGRSMEEVMPSDRSPAALLERVGEVGSAVQRQISFPDGEERWVTITYHAVGEEDEILVLAQDVSEQVRERVRAELFTELVGQLVPTLDARSVVRSVVTQIQHVLAAKSSSIFIVAGAVLHGAPGEWDWTRTSFTVPLADWPTIAGALESPSALYLTREDARESEIGWFEQRGITSTLCVPLLVEQRRVGVLFFDFDTTKRPSRSAVTFAENVAVHCAASLARALDQA